MFAELEARRWQQSVAENHEVKQEGRRNKNWHAVLTSVVMFYVSAHCSFQSAIFHYVSQNWRLK